MYNSCHCTHKPPQTHAALAAFIANPKTSIMKPAFIPISTHTRFHILMKSCHRGLERCEAKLKNCTAFPPGPRRCWGVRPRSDDDSWGSDRSSRPASQGQPGELPRPEALVPVGHCGKCRRGDVSIAVATMDVGRVKCRSKDGRPGIEQARAY